MKKLENGVDNFRNLRNLFQKVHWACKIHIRLHMKRFNGHVNQEVKYGWGFSLLNIFLETIS